jgi:hypothetical protein
MRFVMRTQSGVGFPRWTICAVPEKFAQSRHERGTTNGAARTQNPLPARACGFKSHLRHFRKTPPVAVGYYVI